jgi:hypothetical protein
MGKSSLNGRQSGTCWMDFFFNPYYATTPCGSPLPLFLRTMLASTRELTTVSSWRQHCRINSGALNLPLLDKFSPKIAAFAQAVRPGNTQPRMMSPERAAQPFPCSIQKMSVQVWRGGSVATRTWVKMQMIE